MELDPTDFAAVDECVGALFAHPQVVPLDELRFRGMREMNGIIEAIVRGAETDAAIVDVGTSMEGRTIRLVSFNRTAPNHAVFLAFVHSNEPNGWPTLHFLAAALATTGNPISALFPDVGFHLVFVTDPDGLELNAGFDASGHRTVENYLLNYYRPSLTETAIYTFPFDIEGAGFDAPTPGCHALIEVFETYPPFFVNELHGCEFGAALYSTFVPPSDPSDGSVDGDGALFHQLAAAIEDGYGVAPDLLPAPNHMMTVEEKLKTNGVVHGGASTVDEARSRNHGRADVLNIELGLWHSPQIWATDDSSDAVTDAIAFYNEVRASAEKLYDTYYDGWKDLYCDSYQDDVVATRFFLAFNERIVSIQTPLTTATNVFHAAGGPVVLLLRSIVLLMRLGHRLTVLENDPVVSQAISVGVDEIHDFVVNSWSRALDEHLDATTLTAAPVEGIARTLVTAGLNGLRAAYVKNVSGTDVGDTEAGGSEVSSG